MRYFNFPPLPFKEETGDRKDCKQNKSVPPPSLIHHHQSLYSANLEETSEHYPFPLFSRKISFYCQNEVSVKKEWKKLVNQLSGLLASKQDFIEVPFWSHCNGFLKITGVFHEYLFMRDKSPVYFQAICLRLTFGKNKSC